MRILQDDALQQLIIGEEKRQREGLELIPSENYVSRDVLTALGSVFTNKYSEGFPGKRYYGGQEYTDQVESLAIDRAKKLFSADHANVQPHSGAPANMAVYHCVAGTW
jgi:glycine hydroxymethyltransferase